MTFFKGQEEYSVDNKGRVNFPYKMRKGLSGEVNKFVINRGLEKCIEVYPIETWKIKEEQISRLNYYNPEKRYFMRTLLSWAEEIILDGQQRIPIPKRLLNFAGIKSNVIINGMGDHIEIWDPDTYYDYLNQFGGGGEDVYPEIAAKVMSELYNE